MVERAFIWNCWPYTAAMPSWLWNLLDPVNLPYVCSPPSTQYCAHDAEKIRRRGAWKRRRNKLLFKNNSPPASFCYNEKAAGIVSRNRSKIRYLFFTHNTVCTYIPMCSVVQWSFKIHTYWRWVSYGIFQNIC